jgi:hypothetical protein
LLLLTLITHRRRIGVAALLLLDTEQLPETRSFLKHRSLSLFVRVVRGELLREGAGYICADARVRSGMLLVICIFSLPNVVCCLLFCVAKLRNSTEK